MSTINEHGQLLVYQTDQDGFYVGKTWADPDQINKGAFLIPAGCTTESPPVINGGKRAQWVGYKWKMVSQ